VASLAGGCRQEVVNRGGCRGRSVIRASAKLLFADTPKWVFLSYAVPPEWPAGGRAANHLRDEAMKVSRI
jgi:hypothetical protein